MGRAVNPFLMPTHPLGLALGGRVTSNGCFSALPSLAPTPARGSSRAPNVSHGDPTQMLLAPNMRKRAPLLVLVAVLAAGCDRAERPNPTALLILEPGKVERRFGCHVALDDDFNDKSPYAAVRFACRVPESALTEERWWGDQPKPKVFSLDEGDCILLEMDFFCVEEIARGKSVSFRSKYYTVDDSNTVIKHHNRRR